MDNKPIYIDELKRIEAEAKQDDELARQHLANLLKDTTNALNRAIEACGQKGLEIEFSTLDVTTFGHKCRVTRLEPIIRRRY